MGQLCANAITITKSIVSFDPTVLYPTNKQLKDRNNIFNFRSRSNNRQRSSFFREQRDTNGFRKVSRRCRSIGNRLRRFNSLDVPK